MSLSLVGERLAIKERDGQSFRRKWHKQFCDNAGGSSGLAVGARFAVFERSFLLLSEL